MTTFVRIVRFLCAFPFFCGALLALSLADVWFATDEALETSTMFRVGEFLGQLAYRISGR